MECLSYVVFVFVYFRAMSEKSNCKMPQPPEGSNY